MLIVMALIDNGDGRVHHDYTNEDLNFCDVEQWMPIDDYMAQPMMAKNGLMKRISDVGLAKYENGYAGFTPVGVHSAFSDYKSHLYLNSRDLKHIS